MSETRLEKVIESTAEAETELTPETRLEKVILDTGRKIQEEIAEGGGKLYKHYISLRSQAYPLTSDFIFTMYNSSDTPITIAYIKSKFINEIINGFHTFTDGLTVYHNYAMRVSENNFRFYSLIIQKTTESNYGTVLSFNNIVDYSYVTDVITEV